MNPRTAITKIFVLVGTVALCGGCAGLNITHVAPGESMNAALAKKADLVRLPAEMPLHDPMLAGALPSVEPALPAATSVDERVAEAYSRGEFCLGGGKEDEAISAFEEVVQLDPTFTEAWQNLAMLYEKKGDSKKAMTAFRRSKKIAQH